MQTITDLQTARERVLFVRRDLLLACAKAKDAAESVKRAFADLEDANADVARLSRG